MSQTVEEWIRQISAEPLPAMQRTLTQVRDLLNNKTSVNHPRLSEVISRDPGFSLYVMHQLGSSSKKPREEITKISLALPMLGMTLIENANKTLPCLEEKLQGPPRRGLIGCYSRAAHAAQYALDLSVIRNQSDGDSLYTCALLHDIGEMAIWCHAPHTMLKIQRKIEAGEDRESVANDVLGFTFETLNIKLSERWQLPDLIRNTQCLFNSFQPKPLTVLLASALARETSLGWSSKKTLEDLELLAEFLEISQEQAIAKMHRFAVEAARTLQTLPLPLPAFFIISSEWKGSDKRQTKAAQPALKQPQSSVKKQSNQPLKEKHPPPAQKTNPLQEKLSNALLQMHHELGLSRTMFAMLTPDRKMLRSRLVIESEKQLSLKEFALSTTTPSLFKLLLAKPQAISLNKNNAEKYLPMIPPEAREQINTSGFISMSIFIRSKPIGLFYADNGLGGPGVTRQQYENFKVICQQVVQTMSGS